ncbi:MAG: CAP domain-containing protein [Leptospirales bacterium]|nr:CAP domain-containing protein [Leptospirales bacterium]
MICDRIKRVAALLASLSVASVIAFGCQSSGATAAAECPDVRLSGQWILEAANRLRRQNGRNALIDDSSLDRIALRRANKMAVAAGLDHRADGLTPAQRLQREGIVRNAVGENAVRLAGGADFIRRAFAAWSNGAQERANLLDASFVRVGFAQTATTDGDCLALLLLSD